MGIGLTRTDLNSILSDIDNDDNVNGKTQIRNDYVYYCYNLWIMNLIYVVLEEGHGENNKCMKYIDF